MTYYAADEVWRGNLPTPAEGRVAILRLMRDEQSMKHDPPSGISASPVKETNLFVWQATIVGPHSSPWEGGIFKLSIRFPDQYPNKPPFIRFISEMFHPNVFADGCICLDIIRDKWNPVHTIGSVLSSIQSLLCDPNNDSPANIEASRLFCNDPAEYRRRVRLCAQKSLQNLN